VGIVQQNQARGQNTSRQAVPRLPHDQEDDRDCQGTENRRQGAEGDIGHLINDIRIADVIKVEVTIISNQPAHKGEQQLAERGVHIKEVCPLEVV